METDPFADFRAEKRSGKARPASDLRTVVNGIFYANKTGCQWEDSAEGVRQVADRLRLFLPLEQGRRVAGNHGETYPKGKKKCRGREAEPSAGCSDSRSVKTATWEAATIGYDGNKKINGRKRHALVDTLGLLLCVAVTAAGASDREGLTGTVSPQAQDGFGKSGPTGATLAKEFGIGPGD